MQSRWAAGVSAFGIPVLGLGGLLFSLWHMDAPVNPAQTDQTLVYLLDPDPRLDKSLTVCLRQQAKEVALCRARLRQARTRAVQDPITQAAEARWRRAGLAQATAGYNLIAQECTPAVFQTTHLPPSMEQ